MKKFIILFSAILLAACSTTIDQTEKYGVVEEVLLTNNKYIVKVWDGKKYYNVYTNRLYNIGQTIKIK